MLRPSSVVGIFIGGALAMSCDRSSSCLTPGSPGPVPCDTISRVVPLRQVTHQGRGVEVDVRVFDTCGNALPARSAECLKASGGAEVAPRNLSDGHVMLLVGPPRDAAAQGELLRGLDVFLNARPEGERIAIHRWGAEVTQVSDFTRDKDRLLFLAKEAFGKPEDPPSAAGSAVADARGVVETVAGTGSLALRAVVVIAPGSLRQDLPDGPSVVLWLDTSANAEDGNGLAEQATAASRTLGFMGDAGAVGVGTCGATEVVVSAPSAKTSQAVRLIPWSTDDESATCDPKAVAEGTRSYPRKIQFVFTPEERRVYEARVGEEDRHDFTLSVKIGDSARIPAKAHLRGRGSLHCERKSYSVNLDGNLPRHIMPGAATDEFLLMSMCWDEAYIQAFTAFQLLAPLDLFPPKFDYVELVIDGESQGVYLLVEKPKDTLLGIHARPRALLRRRHDGEGRPPELRYLVKGWEDVISDYDALAEQPDRTTGKALIAEVSRRMDLSQYLRWVAIMSVLRNGDYGDEVFFLSTERHGEPRSYFTIMAWDPDDILVRIECSWQQFAFADRWDLAHCAEGTLDHAILGDPEIYKLYISHVERVLSLVTEQAFSAALETASSKLLSFLSEPRVRAASIELGSPATIQDAEKLVRKRVGLLSGRYRERRALLIRRLAAYHAAN
ncbi:MAG: CotH kinase family protein [Deltaproteobacteria bacterium]|nr:CotH kinase family protein [Deltaproteobacteria bacterium]